jgi:5-methylcytosine-specific restriction endonuclease McrA
MLTSQVITAVKRTFSRSKAAIKFKEKSVIKGVKGKRGGKIGRCSVCAKNFPLYKLNIDHIDSIVPVMIPGKIMSFIMFYSRVFCDENNLQIICPTCHDKKSSKERGERVKWRKRKKFVVARHKYGGKIRVIPLQNNKDFPEDWEAMAVHKTRRDADKEAKRIKKL